MDRRLEWRCGPGGNFLPRFSFDAITLLEWPQVTNNCLSYENLGLFLCIDTKNSSLCSVVLKLWPCKQRRSKLKFSSKTDKNLKFWATDEFYTSKESWKHVTFIFMHKKTIFCKNFFFGKFDFCIEGPPFGHFWQRTIFKKKCQKWLFWDISDIERNKVKKFGECSAMHVDTADDICWSGQKMPPPLVQIGLRW